MTSEKVALEQGMNTLRDDGLAKARKGHVHRGDRKGGEVA